MTYTKETIVIRASAMTWCLVGLSLSLGACKKSSGGNPPPTYTCSATVVDGTCAADQTCLGGACVATSTLCSTANPTGTCAAEEGCLNGTCVIAATLCSTSNPTGACDAADSCLNGMCQLTSALCSATNPTGLCATGSTCYNNTCTPQSSFCGATDPTGICSAAGMVCQSGMCVTPEGECSSDANIAYGRSIAAAQPVIGVQPGTGKTDITADATWTSLDGGTDTCSISVHFKDSNGNGTLDPYEDWTQPVASRVSDLLARMTTAEKAALLVHPTLSDVPAASPYTVLADTQALVTAGVRFGLADADAGTAAPAGRATWADNLQTACETTALGVPFVVSSTPMHNSGNGRALAADFTLWPQEMGLAAAGGASIIQQFGQYAAADYKAIGVRMALSPSADLATDARWFNGQFTFGEDSASVSADVQAYIKGFQGDTLGPTSVACVVSSFPGAGAATGGWDGRLAKGKFLTYPADKLDDHLAAFQGAFNQGVAGVMPAYGIPQAGNWTALSGAIDGTTIEQVGASFNSTLITTVLRNHYNFGGMVLAPWGVLEDPGVSPLGAPWGEESATPTERAAAAINAGVDQFGGLSDPTVITGAVTANLITQAQVDTAAGRVLMLMFTLGLFENPYVDATKAAGVVTGADEITAASTTYDHSLVLLLNAQKPADWLEGDGDGTQSGDPGNAGNSSGMVLPAPPGLKYVWHGASYYVGTGFDLNYIRSVASNGHYGELSNDETTVGCTGAPDCTQCNAPTVATRIACSNYYFVRILSPVTVDPDSGPLSLPEQPLSWADNNLTSALSDLAAARAAINANPGSQTQIIVAIDAGRLPILDEILAYNPAGVYVDWSSPSDAVDQTFLDVVFGYVDGEGILPAGLPLSDAAVAASQEDLAGDAESATYVRGFGLDTVPF